MPQTPSFFIPRRLSLYNRLAGQRLPLRSGAASATQPVVRPTVDLGFANPEMQALLLRLLDTAGVTCDASNGMLSVSERYEDALMSLFDAVRDIRFESWHSFRPLDPARLDAYRNYMAKKEIPYEEEIQNDVTWFLVPHGCNQYEWGIEEFGHS